VKELLEWSPMVIVSATCLAETLAWGIKVDAVLLEPRDETKVRAALDGFQPCDLIFCAPGSNQIAEAFQYLDEHNQKALNIFSSNLDRSRNALDFFTQQRGIALFAAGARWFPLTSGRFTKWVVRGTRFLISQSGEVICTGLSRHAAFLEATSDGFISIESSQPVWVGEILE
jgi:hypothetical protein